MGKFQDLSGQTFGRLKVIDCAGKNKHNQYLWLCECSCGNQKVVSGGNLKQGYVRSCGCLAKESIHIKHGLSRSRIRATYAHMKDRCLNEKCKSYNDYGGRGITVFKGWLGSEGFLNFCKWAFENGYDDSLTLDRIDNDKGYSPDNCRWADQKTQNCNKRNNHYINIDGEIKTVKEWCEIYNISTHTFYYRKRKLNMNEVDAITMPLTSGGIYGSRVIKSASEQ